jgi:putative flippase GtrA
VVDLGVFDALADRLLPIPTAAALAFGVAALVNYALTSRFVFREPPSWRGLGVFFVFAIVGAAVNVGVTSVGALALGAPALAAKAGGIGTAFLVNFWLNATIVFRSSAARAGAGKATLRIDGI